MIFAKWQYIYILVSITTEMLVTYFYVIQGSLQILNISGNHIDHVIDLKPLNQLTQFLVGDNDLSDLRELLLCVQTWPFLWRLEIAGNPVTQKSKCRDKLILSVPRLGKLN